MWEREEMFMDFYKNSLVIFIKPKYCKTQIMDKIFLF